MQGVADHWKLAKVLIPPTVDDLEQAFKTFFVEIQKCAEAKCYWALLHLVVVMPDVCAALEHPRGYTTGESGERYTDWCVRYWRSQAISADKRWAIRCALLHQGRTVLKRGDSFSYISPAPAGSRTHEYVNSDEGNITLEVDKLAVEVQKAVRAWFEDLQRVENAGCLSNVARNLPWLAREKPKAFPPGVMIAGRKLDSGNISSTEEDRPRWPASSFA
jgi:hypothetical protein